MPRRRSSCCTRASAASGCGAIFPTNCRRRPAPASSSIRAPATANRARSRCRARSPTCTTRRATTLPRLLDAIGFQRGLLVGHSDGASIAAIYAGSHQDHRVGGLVLIAPHFFTEDAGIASIEEARKAYETTDLRAAARALACRCRQRLQGLERRLARSRFPPMGYHRATRLYPRADADRAGRGRSIRHGQADRGRAGRMLLPGRGRAAAGRQALAAARGAGGDAEGDRGFRRPHLGERRPARRECLTPPPAWRRCRARR